VYWGIGHTATLFIIGIILILMKGEIPEKWAMSLEFLVGIMLVYLGITTILSFRNIHLHKHEHDGELHKHAHSHDYSGVHEHYAQHKKISYLKSDHEYSKWRLGGCDLHPYIWSRYRHRNAFLYYLDWDSVRF
jgi:ABC-type nickel/cobalt efflux system permease component RcnA